MSSETACVVVWARGSIDEPDPYVQDWDYCSYQAACHFGIVYG